MRFILIGKFPNIKREFVLVVLIHFVLFSSPILEGDSPSLFKHLYDDFHVHNITVDKMELISYKKRLLSEKLFLYKIPIQYRDIVKIYQKKVPYEIIYKLISHESNWNEKAINSKNTNGTKDYGLGQLNSRYVSLFVEKYAKEDKHNFDVFNGSHNLKVAVQLLEYNYAYYLKKGYSSDRALSLGIMAYNCGRGAVNTRQIPQSTLQYLKKIRDYKELKEIDIDYYYQR